MPDIREHVVERYAKRDDHEDVGQKREWYKVFKLSDLTGEYERSKDKQHVPENVEFMIWKVVI